jgi:hypothetical protein
MYTFPLFRKSLRRFAAALIDLARAYLENWRAGRKLRKTIDQFVACVLSVQESPGATPPPPHILDLAEERGWIAFNEECFGWMRADCGFDPLPMPREWQNDPRGAQIETSRRMRCQRLGVPYERAVYSDDAHYPSRDEQISVHSAHRARMRRG